MRRYRDRDVRGAARHYGDDAAGAFPRTRCRRFDHVYRCFRAAGAHLLQLPAGIAVADADHRDEVGIATRDKNTAFELGRITVGTFWLPVAPEHVGGVLACADESQAVAGFGGVVTDGAVGPMGDEVAFAVRMEADAIGAAAGFELFDKATGSPGGTR